MKSFRSEVERLTPFLRQFARALVVGDRPDAADDLVHDTVAEVLRTESGAAEDVLARVLTRLIHINRARGRSAVGERRTAPGAGGDGRPAAVTFGSGHGMDALLLNDREALLLVVLGRLDYPQAAAVLNIPVTTLITRLLNARETLGASLWETAAPGAAANRPAAAGRHLRLVKS